MDKIDEYYLNFTETSELLGPHMNAQFLQIWLGNAISFFKLFNPLINHCYLTRNKMLQPLNERNLVVQNSQNEMADNEGAASNELPSTRERFTDDSTIVGFF